MRIMGGERLFSADFLVFIRTLLAAPHLFHRYPCLCDAWSSDSVCSRCRLPDWVFRFSSLCASTWTIRGLRILSALPVWVMYRLTFKFWRKSCRSLPHHPLLVSHFQPSIWTFYWVFVIDRDDGSYLGSFFPTLRRKYYVEIKEGAIFLRVALPFRNHVWNGVATLIPIRDDRCISALLPCLTFRRQLGCAIAGVEVSWSSKTNDL